MRPRLGMIFSIPPTLATLLVAAMIAAGTWASTYWCRSPNASDRQQETVAVVAILQTLAQPASASTRANMSLIEALDEWSENVGLKYRLTPAAASWERLHPNERSGGWATMKASIVLKSLLWSLSDDQLVFGAETDGVVVMAKHEYPLDPVEAEVWADDAPRVLDGTITIAEMSSEARRFISAFNQAEDWKHPRTAISPDSGSGLIRVRHSRAAVLLARQQIEDMCLRFRPSPLPPLQIRAGKP